MRYHALIHHNETPGHRFEGYEEGDALFLVFDCFIEAISNQQACDVVFEFFNRDLTTLRARYSSFRNPSVQDAESYRRKKLRSLSVGDVVVLVPPGKGAPEAWACSMVGWQEVPVPEGRVP